MFGIEGRSEHGNDAQMAANEIVAAGHYKSTIGIEIGVATVVIYAQCQSGRVNALHVHRIGAIETTNRTAIKRETETGAGRIQAVDCLQFSPEFGSNEPGYLSTQTVADDRHVAHSGAVGL